MRSFRSRVKRNRPLRTAVFHVQNMYHASPLGARANVVAATPAGPRRYHLAAMIRVKDEARFLPEWLAYHVALGVEHCVIYDNNSGDDIESVMRPFIDRDLATYVPWPTVPASPSAHEHFLRRFGPDSEWVAFLDADEFVVERRPGALREVLQRHARRPAVAINSRYFGSAGHDRIPAGLVTEQFDRADAASNEHVKVIAQPSAIRAYRNPHNFYYRHARLARTPGGRRVLGSFVRPVGDAELVLHHYLYRSREDYERKATRGYSTATGAKADVRQLARADREFDRHNDVRATVPGNATQATARLLEELGYPSDLYVATPARANA
jgi:Glycosyltransferase family 92